MKYKQLLHFLFNHAKFILNNKAGFIIINTPIYGVSLIIFFLFLHLISSQRLERGEGAKETTIQMYLSAFTINMTLKCKAVANAKKVEGILNKILNFNLNSTERDWGWNSGRGESTPTPYSPFPLPFYHNWRAETIPSIQTAI